jgi:hypothetical protein
MNVLALRMAALPALAIRYWTWTDGEFAELRTNPP